MMREIMIFSGLWENKKTKETILISRPNGSDVYVLEFNKIQNEFQNKEEIAVSITDTKHARLQSQYFGGQHITLINKNCFQIKQGVYTRVL